MRLDALAGLRVFAAAAVAVAHLPPVLAHPGLGPTARRMLSEGMYGVSLFFVLSGFVLAYGYHARLRTLTRPGLRAYYVARVARVWPVHLFALGLAVLLPFHSQPGGWAELLANAVLVHAWVPDLRFIQSYNAVSWSLSVEAFFYLVFPLLICAAGRSRLGPAGLALAAGGVWAAGAAVVFPVAVGADGFGPLYLCNVCPPVRAVEFTVGVLLGLAYVRAGTAPGPAAGSARRWWTLAEVGVCAAFLVHLFHCHRLPLLFRMNGYYTPVFAAAVLLFACQRGAVSRLLAARPAVYLGQISYAFFLLHCLVFVHLGPLLPDRLDGWPRAGVLAAAALLAAAGVYHAVELPLRERILRWANGRPKPVEMGPLRRAA